MSIVVTLREACGLSAIEAENDRLELLDLKTLELWNLGGHMVLGVRHDMTILIRSSHTA